MIKDIICHFNSIKQAKSFIVCTNNKIPVEKTNFLIQDNRLTLLQAYTELIKRGQQSHSLAVVIQDIPYFCIDIDHCISEDGVISELAQKLLDMFTDAYHEISLSGRGYHIIGRGTIEHASCKNDLGIEFYTEKRFIILTGTDAVGSIEVDCTHILGPFVEEFFKGTKRKDAGYAWTSTPTAMWKGPEDDEHLLRLAMSSRARIKRKASFAELFNADSEILAQFYPHTKATYDASRADAALAQMLCYWTGNNCERIERIMRLSNLDREKWEREDYIRLTITNACAQQAEFLHIREQPVINAEFSHFKVREGTTFLDAEQQLELFKECYYVIEDDKILVPGGQLLNESRFNAVFGGYTMLLNAHHRDTTTQAWKAFTQSQFYVAPKVHTTVFDPLISDKIITLDNRQTAVNVFVPFHINKISGDASLFITHLRKLNPDLRDTQILLSYMAHCIQNPWIKATWCPVLQGVQGNGKTYICVVMMRAVGSDHSYAPKASELPSKFNGYIPRARIICVDDVDFSTQRHFIEMIKPMISNNFMEIENKGRDKYMRPIYANFFITTNHADGIPKTENERRFVHLLTAQQDKSDLDRDEMGAGYFNRLWNWTNKEHGLEIIADFLGNYNIEDEFNPSKLARRAPETSTALKALEAGISEIETVVGGLIEEHLPGLRNGWVSQTMLMSHLIVRHYHFKMADIKKCLYKLGFVMHPVLSNGRTNNKVLPDSCKPRIWITKNHDSIKLGRSSLIENSYELDQRD